MESLCARSIRSEHADHSACPCCAHQQTPPRDLLRTMNVPCLRSRMPTVRNVAGLSSRQSWRGDSTTTPSIDHGERTVQRALKYAMTIVRCGTSRLLQLVEKLWPAI